MLTQNQHTAPRLVGVNDAAIALGVCRRTIYRLIDGGTLRTTKVGRLTKIPAADIDAVVASAA